MKLTQIISKYSPVAFLAASATLSPAQTPVGTPSAPPPSLLDVIKINAPMPVLKVQQADSTVTASMESNKGFQDSLLAYYPFDGNASDMSGNGHHGTVSGAILTEDRNGEHGKAYLFDGQDDFIDFGNHPVFNSFPLTVAVWINSNGNNGESGIVSKYRSASWNGWQIMEQQDKIVPWYIRSHGQRIIGNYGEPKPFETVLENPESWNHLVCVFDEDGGRIYLNGSLQDTKDWTGTPSAPTASHGLYVGRYKGSDTRSGFYSGKIDDVRIYGRTLSALEVSALHHLKINDSTPEPIDLRAGLLAHYPYSGNVNEG